jgi:hypothetical protein
MTSALRRALSSALGTARAVPTVAPTWISPTTVAVDAEDYLRQHWPQCLSAKQPTALPKTFGEPQVIGRWARDAKKFRLRSPATSPNGLVGPFRGVGDCLVPYFRPGDLTWIDPDAEPADGDFLCVLWSEQFFARLMQVRDRFTQDLGRIPSGIACKRLLRHGGEWLVTSLGYGGTTAALPLAGNARVLGVVRFVQRAGTNQRHALPAHCIQIDKVTFEDHLAPSVATEVYTGSFAGPTTYPASSGQYTPCSASFTPDTHVGLAQVIATFDAAVDIGGSQNQVQLRVTGAATQSGLTFQTDMRRYTIQSFATYTPGVTVTADLYVDTDAGVAVTLARAQVRLEVIKR